MSPRTLAARLGITERSLESARALARWAEQSGELGLALALWEGCASLDDLPSSWRAVARVAGSLRLSQVPENTGLLRTERHDRS